MLRLEKGQKNTTVDCFGYAKPAPTVRWKKGAMYVSLMSMNSIRDQVVQQIYNTTSSSPWNVTSRLYLSISGATFTEGGNYTCEVYNALGADHTVNQTIEVACK